MSGTFKNGAAIENATSSAQTAINTDIGDYSAQTNLQSLLAALGIPDVSGKPLYTCLVTDRLDNGTYGLSALDTELGVINADIGDFSSQTYLQSALAALGIPDVENKPLYTCLITDRLDNATYGLSAIETLVDDLETRLTSTRAGYLDNLSAGAVAVASTALTNATWTDARAGYLDNLSAGAVALAANQLTDATWTDARAGYLDNLSAGAVALAANQLTDATWTDARAGYLDHLVAADTASTHDITTANDQTETDVFSISATTMYQLSVYVDLNVLVTAVEGGTVTLRLYNKIDETNYREIATTAFIVGTTTTHPNFEVMMCNHNSKLTIQCSDDVTETRTINYRYITRPIE